MKKITFTTKITQIFQVLFFAALVAGGLSVLSPAAVIAATPATTSSGGNTATDGRTTSKADSGPASSSATLRDTLAAICHKKVSGKADAGCDNSENITHVYNIATQQCEDKTTVSGWESCIKSTSASFFSKADSYNPQDQKSFTSVLSTRVLAGKGNPSRPSSKKPSASPDVKCNGAGDFLGFRSWYHYLKLSKDGCDIENFNLLPSDSQPSDVPLVLLAIIDDLLRLAGLIAVGFVLFGGLKYIASQGNPEDTAKAQGTVLNALLGLAISLVAVAFVAYLGSQLGG